MTTDDLKYVGHAPTRTVAGDCSIMLANKKRRHHMLGLHKVHITAVQWLIRSVGVSELTDLRTATKHVAGGRRDGRTEIISEGTRYTRSSSNILEAKKVMISLGIQTRFDIP